MNAIHQANQNPEDRRQYTRVRKNFVLSYFILSDPSVKHVLTQLKNVSLGGMCFVTTRLYAPDTKLDIELKTPYLAETTHLEGVVLESHEKIKNTIYETRLKFDTLSPPAEFVLKKVVEYFKNDKGDSHGHE